VITSDRSATTGSWYARKPGITPCPGAQAERPTILVFHDFRDLGFFRADLRIDLVALPEAVSGARRLLADDAGTALIFHDYLVTAAMLGDIAVGRAEDALATWSRYSEKAFANRQLPGHVELISRIALDSAVKVAGRSDVGSP